MECFHSLLILLEKLYGLLAGRTWLLRVSGGRIPKDLLFYLHTLGIDTGTLNAIPRLSWVTLKVETCVHINSIETIRSVSRQMFAHLLWRERSPTLRKNAALLVVLAENRRRLNNVEWLGDFWLDFSLLLILLQNRRIIGIRKFWILFYFRGRILLVVWSGLEGTFDVGSDPSGNAFSLGPILRSRLEELWLHNLDWWLDRRQRLLVPIKSWNITQRLLRICSL